MNEYTHFKHVQDDQSACETRIHWALDGQPVADGETLEVMFPDGTTASFTTDVERDSESRDHETRFSCGLEMTLNGYDVVVPVSEALKARRV